MIRWNVRMWVHVWSIFYQGFSELSFAGIVALQRRHNECDCVSNNQRFDCLPNCLFRRRSQSIPTGEFPAQKRKMFPFDDVIMNLTTMHAKYVYITTVWPVLHDKKRNYCHCVHTRKTQIWHFGMSAFTFQWRHLSCMAFHIVKISTFCPTTCLGSQ